MLLQHAWLAPLVMPAAIMEEDEEEISDDTPASETTGSESDNDSAKGSDTLNKSTASLRLPDDVIDQEVAEWVLQAVEKRRQGKLGKSEKPALHAAPLDAVASPVAEKKGEPNGVQPPPAPAQDAA
jgi:mitogen-activated protein kinase kinase